MFTSHKLDKLYSRLDEFNLIVEGKRDKQALSKLGFKNIHKISRMSIQNFIERLPKNSKYVILTDFDREGERKNKIFCKFFEKHGILFNKRLRNSFRSIFKITKVEELKKFQKIKEDDFYGKISTVDNKIFNRSKVYNKRDSRKTRHNRCYLWPN